MPGVAPPGIGGGRAPAQKTAKAFQDWLVAAAPGARVQYHRGVLASDLARRDRAELRNLAEVVRLASALGDVMLIQRRYGEDDYGYLAVRRDDYGYRAGRRATGSRS